MTDTDEALEAAAKAIFRARFGQHADPEWPVGIDRLGYHQEPYIDSIPKWKWEGCDRDARAALTAASVHTGERMATDDDARKAAHAAFDRSNYGNPSAKVALNAALDAYRSAPRAPEPMAGAVDGWKPVPVEPTGEMWSTCRKLFHDLAEQCRRAPTYEAAAAIADGAPVRLHDAMLAASPPPPDGWRGIESAPRDANAMTIVEIQAEIGRLQGVLHFKVCGDPRVSVSVSPPGEELGKG